MCVCHSAKVTLTCKRVVGRCQHSYIYIWDVPACHDKGEGTSVLFLYIISIAFLEVVAKIPH